MRLLENVPLTPTATAVRTCNVCPFRAEVECLFDQCVYDLTRQERETIRAALRTIVFFLRQPKE